VNGVNAFLDWLASKPAWAIDVAILVPLFGAWAATLIRIAEKCRDDDAPLPVPVPAVAAVPVTLDLGPFELLTIEPDALEATS
jgi:hypothetical protein